MPGTHEKCLSHPSAVESHKSSLGSKTSLWFKSFGILSNTTTSGVFVDEARMTSRRVLELPSPLVPEAMAIANRQDCLSLSKNRCSCDNKMDKTAPRIKPKEGKKTAG